MNLLVVDDDPDFVEWLSAFLAGLSANARVFTADCIREAKQLLADTETPGFDFLFLDERLPGQNGIEALPHLLTFDTLKGAHLVMLTGDYRDEVRGRALAAGFDAFLSKPIDEPRLIRMVSERRVHWEPSDLPQDMECYWALVGGGAGIASHEKTEDPSRKRSAM